MSSDREVTSIVRSWLEEGVTVLPDRVLDNVLDQLPATQQRRSWWPARRDPIMNPLRIAATTAAVIAVALVGISLVPGEGVGTGPILAPSPSAAPSPITRALPAIGSMAPGAYVLDNPFPVRLSLVVGEGWNIWAGPSSAGAAIYKESIDPPNGRGVIVTVVDNVYADACNPAEGLLDPPLGPTVDDLATALAGQPMTDASPITDTSVDGYTGKYLEYTKTDSDAGCSVGQSLVRWPSAGGPRQAIQDELDKVWIVDVHGVRLVIDAFFFPGGGHAADYAEIQAIVDSIRIEAP